MHGGLVPEGPRQNQSNRKAWRASLLRRLLSPLHPPQRRPVHLILERLVADRSRRSAFDKVEAYRG
eukprot:1512597-Rhodomonas_salina.2